MKKYINKPLYSKFRKRSYNEKINTFYEYLNPLCLSIGVIGFLLYFEINYFEIRMIGLGLWWVTGALDIEAKKK